jgi:hypothetical protein
MHGVFVGFSNIFLLGILIFKELTAQRLCNLYGVKGLIRQAFTALFVLVYIYIYFSLPMHRMTEQYFSIVYL